MARVGANTRLTAVRWITIAILKAHFAAGDSALTRHAGGHAMVHHASATTSAAIGRIANQRHLTTVGTVEVAIAKPGRTTLEDTGAHLTARVHSRRAGLTARAAAKLRIIRGHTAPITPFLSSRTLDIFPSVQPAITGHCAATGAARDAAAARAP